MMETLKAAWPNQMRQKQQREKIRFRLPLMRRRLLLALKLSGYRFQWSRYFPRLSRCHYPPHRHRWDKDWPRAIRQTWFATHHRD